MPGGVRALRLGFNGVNELLGGHPYVGPRQPLPISKVRSFRCLPRLMGGRKKSPGPLNCDANADQFIFRERAEIQLEIPNPDVVGRLALPMYEASQRGVAPDDL